MSAAEASAANVELPTREEIQAQFTDQINRYTFALTNVPVWKGLTTWRRASEIVFPSHLRDGVDEPVRSASLPDKTIQVFHRTNQGAREYQVVEQVGRQPTNYFPVFDGLPRAFVFHDDTIPTRSNRQTCRPIREYLACRIIWRNDGTVSYETLTSGATKSPAPTILELLALFADQLRMRTFGPTGVTAWEQRDHWRRIAQIVFNAPDDERTVPPMRIDPIPKELRLFSRQTNHGTQTGIVEWADPAPFGLPELFNHFPIFRGNLQAWTFYDTELFEDNKYEETCRMLRKGGTEFLLCRTILHGESAFYQTYLRIAPTGSG